MQENKFTLLRIDILDELGNLERRYDEINNYYPSISEPPTLVEIIYLASNLHDFYLGVEKIFEKIARNIDQQIPKGEFWHSELLRQMSQEFGAVRPAIITKALSDKLEDYLRFRHLTRNVYGFHLDWERMKPLIVSFDSVFTEFRQCLTEFLNFLDNLIQATQK